MRVCFTFTLIVALAACGRGEHTSANGPEMRPGENCLGCHRFTVAGTVFGAVDASAGDGLGGATIDLTDAKGQHVTLSSNAAGNFYGSAALTFPLTASVTQNGTTKTMTQKVTSGGCSACHAVPGASGAPGRLYVGP